jgi:abortive infection bacteriophage resistance protein
MRTRAGFFVPVNPYPKHATTIQEQLTKLESRGLEIADRDRAEHYLRYISYYRLVGYGLSLEEFDDNGNRLDQFKNGTSFEDILNLYVFDRELRVLVIDAIERIEVAARSVIVYVMSNAHSDPHWFMNNQLFMPLAPPVCQPNQRTFDHSTFIGKVKRGTQYNADAGSDREKVREKFIHHYYSKYNSPDLPPSWMIAEVLSMGVWSTVYEGLRISRDRKDISKEFDLGPDTMQSWLHCLAYLRNLCAHHGRIYNRKLILPPKNDKNTPGPDPHTFARYAALTHYFLEIIAPDSKWVDRLDVLMRKHEVELFRLGFADNWRDNPFWNNPD